ncbi:hypothetical protein HDU98_007960 [Podochytrium sp. JEL0797]|nr:hypothetical protein HDU98_007960 [Podochytrium sp. JEL0797]
MNVIREGDSSSLELTGRVGESGDISGLVRTPAAPGLLSSEAGDIAFPGEAGEPGNDALQLGDGDAPALALGEHDAMLLDEAPGGHIDEHDHANDALDEAPGAAPGEDGEQPGDEGHAPDEEDGHDHGDDDKDPRFAFCAECAEEGVRLRAANARLVLETVALRRRVALLRGVEAGLGVLEDELLAFLQRGEASLPPPAFAPSAASANDDPTTAITTTTTPPKVLCGLQGCFGNAAPGLASRVALSKHKYDFHGDVRILFANEAAAPRVVTREPDGFLTCPWCSARLKTTATFGIHVKECKKSDPEMDAVAAVEKTLAARSKRPANPAPATPTPSLALLPPSSSSSTPPSVPLPPPQPLPFKCTVESCPQSFANKRAMYNHKWSYHATESSVTFQHQKTPTQIQRNPVDKLIHCPCGRVTFENWNGLRQHADKCDGVLKPGAVVVHHPQHHHTHSYPYQQQQQQQQQQQLQQQQQQQATLPQPQQLDALMASEQPITSTATTPEATGSGHPTPAIAVGGTSTPPSFDLSGAPTTTNNSPIHPLLQPVPHQPSFPSSPFLAPQDLTSTASSRPTTPLPAAAAATTTSASPLLPNPNITPESITPTHLPDGTPNTLGYLPWVDLVSLHFPTLQSTKRHSQCVFQFKEKHRIAQVVMKPRFGKSVGRSLVTCVPRALWGLFVERIEKFEVKSRGRVGKVVAGGAGEGQGPSGVKKEEVELGDVVVEAGGGAGVGGFGVGEGDGVGLVVKKQNPVGVSWKEEEAFWNAVGGNQEDVVMGEGGGVRVGEMEDQNATEDEEDALFNFEAAAAEQDEQETTLELNGGTSSMGILEHDGGGSGAMTRLDDLMRLGDNNNVNGGNPESLHGIPSESSTVTDSLAASSSTDLAFLNSPPANPPHDPTSTSSSTTSTPTKKDNHVACPVATCAKLFPNKNQMSVHQWCFHASECKVTFLNHTYQTVVVRDPRDQVLRCPCGGFESPSGYRLRYHASKCAGVSLGGGSAGVAEVVAGRQVERSGAGSAKRRRVESDVEVDRVIAESLKHLTG